MSPRPAANQGARKTSKRPRRHNQGVAGPSLLSCSPNHACTDAGSPAAQGGNWGNTTPTKAIAAITAVMMTAHRGPTRKEKRSRPQRRTYAPSRRGASTEDLKDALLQLAGTDGLLHP